MTETNTKLTVPDLIKKKQNRERVVMVAAADFLMAQWAERSGIDFIGIGDLFKILTDESLFKATIKVLPICFAASRY